MVSSNSRVRSSPKTKILFLLLSTCMEKLLSTSEITIFLPYSPSDHENYEHASNPIS